MVTDVDRASRNEERGGSRHQVQYIEPSKVRLFPKPDTVPPYRTLPFPTLTLDEPRDDGVHPPAVEYLSLP